MTTKKHVADDLHEQGFHVIDNFLDPDHYHALRTTIQKRHSEGDFRQAKIGQKRNKTHDADVRNDQILWLEKEGGHEAIHAYFSKLDNLCETLNQSLFLGLIDYEAHCAVYPPNSFYKKHVDQFENTKDRRVSCVYYLNNNWEQTFGGALTLYDNTDQPLTSIMPLGNRFVCFNSNIPHEVCTTFTTRYSIAAWLKVRPLTSP